MPTSETEAAEDLAARIEAAGMTAASVARLLGRSPLWVQRRLNRTTRLRVDDYNLISECIDKEIGSKAAYRQ